MLATTLTADWPAHARHPVGVPASDDATLEALRAYAQRARASRRLDLDHACNMLSTEPQTAARAFADALLRTLRQALGRAPVIHTPGSPDVSFDEAWLLRALKSSADADHDSLYFLLASRVTPPRRRGCAFLICGLAARLDFL